MKLISMIFITCIIYFIKIYQKYFSRFTGKCRFHPTCSSYAILALKKYGLITGVKLSFNRLLRCKPNNYESCIDYP
jgi:uncharacterized protein